MADEAAANEAQSKKAAKKLAAKAEKAAKVCNYSRHTFSVHYTIPLKYFRKLNTKQVNNLRLKLLKMEVKTSLKESMDMHN